MYKRSSRHKYFILFYSAFLVVNLSLSLNGSADDLSEARFKTLWNQADAVHTQENYEQSEQLYKNIFSEFPNSQRTALRIAICQEKTGKISESIKSYQDAINIDPTGYWAEVALFFCARACQEAGQFDQSRECIQKLQKEFPDSSYNARARVVESKISKRNQLVAEVLLERELKAAEALEDCMKTSRQGLDEVALLELEDVIQKYPESAASLRALEAKGHILVRNKNFEEAIEPFSEILRRVSKDHPESRITQEAKTRLAAINHVLYKREEALEIYSDILSSTPNAKIEANAALQMVGLAFEILQRRRIDEGELPVDKWEEMRQMGKDALRLQSLTPDQRVLVDLMMVESYVWQADREKSSEAAKKFLEVYQDSGFEKEIATAHFVAGKELRLLEKYDEALEHLYWIVENYPEEDFIWPKMDHVPRTYHMIWEIMRKSGASEAEVRKAAENLVERFPDSPYSEDVKSRHQWQQWHPGERG